MLVRTKYSDYRDNMGLKYPAAIVQKRGGWPTFDAQILGAHANPANLTALMTPPASAGRRRRPAARAARPAPPAAASERLADGVYRITGGYVALAVEFNDHILIFEPAGQNEARAQAIIAEAKRVIPNKPIRYGVLSHHHFDHTSGIAAVVAEGITIVTHEANKEFFENALAAPRTLAPDSMARSGKKAVIETVGDKRVFTDGTQTVEIHNIKGLPHADGMLIAYMPSAQHRRLRRHVQPRGAGPAARAESAGRRHAGVRREPRAPRPRLGEHHLGARAEPRSADHARRHSRDARLAQTSAGRVPISFRDSHGVRHGSSNWSGPVSRHSTPSIIS